MANKKPTIYTTGYTGQNAKVLPALVNKLKACLLDVRISPSSRARQWQKSALETALGRNYQWVPYLGNKNYKGNLGDDFMIADMYVGLSIIEDTLAKYDTVLLMCMCPDYEACHRSLIINELIDRGHEVEDITNWQDFLEELEEAAAPKQRALFYGGPVELRPGEGDLGESLPIQLVGPKGERAPIASVFNFEDFPCVEESDCEDIDGQARVFNALFAHSPKLLAVTRQAFQYATMAHALKPAVREKECQELFAAADKAIRELDAMVPRACLDDVFEKLGWKQKA